jgi:hypothetical protein
VGSWSESGVHVATWLRMCNIYPRLFKAGDPGGSLRHGPDSVPVLDNFLLLPTDEGNWFMNIA